jgi:hypothetical protein
MGCPRRWFAFWSCANGGDAAGQAERGRGCLDSKKKDGQKYLGPGMLRAQGFRAGAVLFESGCAA